MALSLDAVHLLSQTCQQGAPQMRLVFGYNDVVVSGMAREKNPPASCGDWPQARIPFLLEDFYVSGLKNLTGKSK